MNDEEAFLIAWLLSAIGVVAPMFGVELPQWAVVISAAVFVPLTAIMIVKICINQRNLKAHQRAVREGGQNSCAKPACHDSSREGQKAIDRRAMEELLNR